MYLQYAACCTFQRCRPGEGKSDFITTDFEVPASVQRQALQVFHCRIGQSRIDSQHRAAIGRMQRLSSYTPGSDAADPPNVVWTASFHDPAFPDFGPLRHLRYRTIAKVAALTYPFCIRDIPIP